MTASRVAIVLGSDSDLEVFQDAVKTLGEFGIPHEVRILSAHRSPNLVEKFVNEAEGRGIAVIIAGAGMAAHLAGVIASRTTLPVIGVPVASGPLNGVDALYSTVMMPPGIPVATMAVGKSGATNAAIFAAEILALSDARLKAALVKSRQDLESKIAGKDRKVRES
ncbi:MAG: 5-(carboxyamino)imidazole ribonucleotide mutase [Planctomycetota bacterium]